MLLLRRDKRCIEVISSTLQFQRTSCGVALTTACLLQDYPKRKTVCASMRLSEPLPANTRDMLTAYVAFVATHRYVVKDGMRHVVPLPPIARDAAPHARK